MVRARRHVRSRATRAKLTLRAAVWLRSASLDRELAAGATGSELLRLRAEQLVQPRSRARIADWIERAIDGEAARAGRSGRASSQGVAIALAHAEMVWLVAALRTSAEVSPQGVAMALELVRDDASPLRAPLAPTALRDAARRTGELLLPRSRGVVAP